MKPSLFTQIPYGSILHKMEAEITAKNIMEILARTGDVFRELTWKEYSKQRIMHGEFIKESEQKYFDQVIYLCNGNVDQIIDFSSTWKDTYIKHLENK